MEKKSKLKEKTQAKNLSFRRKFLLKRKNSEIKQKLKNQANPPQNLSKSSKNHNQEP